MKSILLVRHAKSSWDDLSVSDMDRPLNVRGKKDAPEMAERLRDRKIDIDAFISSPAKRARKTAQFFAQEYKQGKDDVILKDELYEAGEADFSNVIASLPDKYKVVAIFSHNPGITDFANTLTTTRIDNVPTAGIFAVHAAVDSWSEFAAAPKSFWFFDFPKNEEQ